jgi:hypothetical protein
MRIACWIPKATNIQSEYVILIAFPQQQWLRERVSLVRYKNTASHVTFKLPPSCHFLKPTTATMIIRIRVTLDISSRTQLVLSNKTNKTQVIFQARNKNFVQNFLGLLSCDVRVKI